METCSVSCSGLALVHPRGIRSKNTRGGTECFARGCGTSRPNQVVARCWGDVRPRMSCSARQLGEVVALLRSATGAWEISHMRISVLLLHGADGPWMWWLAHLRRIGVSCLCVHVCGAHLHATASQRQKVCRAPPAAFGPPPSGAAGFARYPLVPWLSFFLLSTERVEVGLALLSGEVVPDATTRPWRERTPARVGYLLPLGLA